MLNLDTHIFLYAIDDQLTTHEQRLVATNQCGISAIVLWEITKLYENRRIKLNLDSPPVVKGLSVVTIWPIDGDVCRSVLRLDFDSDPADELIAATSLTFNVPLLTRDKKIRASKLIQCA